MSDSLQSQQDARTDSIHPSYRTCKGKHEKRVALGEPGAADESVYDFDPSPNLARSQSKLLAKSAAESPPPKRTRDSKKYWTKEQDANLDIGHRRYGFAWTHISKDTTLNLSNKTGAQIRDRFRLRYPKIYDESPGPQKYRDMEKKRRLSNGGDASSDRDADDESSDENESRHRKLSSHQRSKKMTSTSGFPSIKGLLNVLNEDEEEKEHASSSVQGEERKVKATLPPVQWEEKEHASPSVRGEKRKEKEHASSSVRGEKRKMKVTLRPVQWEDMSNKPMFYLD